MTFAAVQSNKNNATTANLSNVTAGHLIVSLLYWSSGTGNCTVSDGTANLTMATPYYYANKIALQFGYLLSADSGNRTYTASNFAGNYHSILVWEFSYAGNCTYDTQGGSNGNSNKLSSGNFTTTGTDELVFAGGTGNTTTTLSSLKINSVANVGNIEESNNTIYMWYNTFSNTFTSNATANMSTSQPWDCCVIAFIESGLANVTLSANYGTYSVSGDSDQMLHARLLQNATGSYSSSGNTDQMLHGRNVLSSSGSYSVSGNTDQMLHTRLLKSTSGSYSSSGQPDSMLYGRVLSSNAGNYSSTGDSDQMLHGWQLQFASGSYGITGDAASLLHSYLAQLGIGTYSLSGIAAALIHQGVGIVLAAQAGSYSLTGDAAQELYKRLLMASPGSFTVTGISANMIIGTPLTIIKVSGVNLLTGEAGIFYIVGKLLT